MTQIQSTLQNNDPLPPPILLARVTIVPIFKLIIIVVGPISLNGKALAL